MMFATEQDRQRFKERMEASAIALRAALAENSETVTLPRALALDGMLGCLEAFKSMHFDTKVDQGVQIRATAA